MAISKTGITEINEQLHSAVDRQAVPGVVGIIANKDRIVYHNAVGTQDAANGTPMRIDTIFRIASMTKPISSVAVMMLYERGELDLDEPVAHFIPSLRSPQVFASFDQENNTYTSRPASTEITIRHLLNHTSGYGYAFSDPILHALERTTGRSPIELPLLHDPGTRWTYGISTAILGDVVRAITHMDLYAFFKSELFEPLGMSDTFYDVPPEKQARVTTCHQRRHNALKEIPNPQHVSYAESGSGSLLSTASDYVRFLQMLLNRGLVQGHRILNEHAIMLMTRNQIGELGIEIQPAADAGKCRPFMLKAKQDRFGLGFRLAGPSAAKQPQRSPGSYSWAGLYNTYFWVDPRQELIAVLLMQILPFYDGACRDLCANFEKAIYRNLT